MFQSCFVFTGCRNGILFLVHQTKWIYTLQRHYIIFISNYLAKANYVIVFVYWLKPVLKFCFKIYQFKFKITKILLCNDIYAIGIIQSFSNSSSIILVLVSLFFCFFLLWWKLFLFFYERFICSSKICPLTTNDFVYCGNKFPSTSII
jgi:hypothetical protein